METLESHPQYCYRCDHEMTNANAVAQMEPDHTFRRTCPKCGHVHRYNMVDAYYGPSSRPYRNVSRQGW